MQKLICGKNISNRDILGMNMRGQKGDQRSRTRLVSDMIMYLESKNKKQNLKTLPESEIWLRFVQHWQKKFNDDKQKLFDSIEFQVNGIQNIYNFALLINNNRVHMRCKFWMVWIDSISGL